MKNQVLKNNSLYEAFIIKFEKARYKHDCCNCKYLGRSREYDLYYCKYKNEATLIARFGSEGWEYQSGIVFATADGIKPLYEAKKRAIKAGLMSINND